MKFLIVGSDRPTNTETNQLTQALGHLWYFQRHLKWGGVEILLGDGDCRDGFCRRSIRWLHQAALNVYRNYDAFGGVRAQIKVVTEC